MPHEFVMEGAFIPFTNTTPNTIPAGEFVLNGNSTVVLGVTTKAIPPNSQGSLYRKYGAIINVDKVPADALVPGTPVNLVVASKLVTSGAGVSVGRSIGTAPAGSTKALIALAV